MNSPKPLYKLLGTKKGNVADLVTRARCLSSINKHLQAYLDVPLSDHCVVAGFQEGILTLVTDSPVWASRLHFYTPTLENELKHNLHSLQGLNKIVIKVQPGFHDPVAAKPAKRIISTASSETLNAMADSIENDDLKQALKRLSRHTKPRHE